MKFCAKCQNLAFDHAIECPSCGAPLTGVSLTSGGTPSSAPPPETPASPPGTVAPAESDETEDPDAQSLQDSIQVLEGQRVAAGRRNRFLSMALLASAALLLIALVVWYQTTVRCYARLTGISMARDPVIQGKVTLTFNVLSPGKVRYVRRCGQLTTEVFERYTTRGPQTCEWNWAYDPGQPIAVTVKHRSAFWRRCDAATFSTSNRVDVVFILDTTESMGLVLEGLPEKCSQFVSRLAASGFEYRVALIGFGDVNRGQPVIRQGLTADPKTFESQLRSVPHRSGGDLPESALEALETALELDFEKDVPVVFLLITDADYHEPTATGSTVTGLAARIRKRGILTYVVSRRVLRGRYHPFMIGGGRFYAIEDKAFPPTLTEIGREIVANAG